MYTNIIHNDDICNYFLKNQQFIFNSLGNCRECRLEGILPWYITRVRALKDKTSLEEARIKQLNRICEATVMPAIGPMAEAASLICTVRARNNSFSIVLKDRKGKSRSFRVGFERPIQDSLGPVMECIKSAAAKGAGNLSPTPCY